MEFQPFSVTCVTCGSRLRVSRQELVGSIVTCPKCQAMVQLTPKPIDTAGEAPIALGNHLVDSNALTEDSISKPDLPEIPSSEKQPESGFAEPPPVFTSDPQATPEASQQTVDQTQTPPPDWHSQKTAKSRRIAMMVAVTLASIVSAAILFGVLTRKRTGDVAQQSPVNPPPAGEEDPSAGTEPMSPTDADPADADPADADPADADPAEAVAVTPESADPKASETETAAADGSPESSSTLTKVSDVTPAGTDDKMQPPPELLPRNPLLPENPLEGMLPLGGSPLDSSPEQPADLSQMTKLPDGLKDLLNGIEMDRPQFEATQPAPQTIDEIQLDRAADAQIDVEVAINQPEPINMRQTLGLSIALQAADPAGYPFNDLMLILGQLSGVPIDVEWVSFEVVGMPIDRPIKLPGSWLTIEEILAAVCEENGAIFEKKARSITVRPSDERFVAAVETILDLSDIQTETESAVATARRLLGQTDGDPSQVSLPSESGPMQLAVLVCESIRRVRGVQGKLPDPLLSRWAGTYQEQLQAWPRLENGVSGSTQLQPTAFVSVVRRIAKLNGATCYLNWLDGAKRNLRPTDEVMPRTGEGISAAEALEQILAPENMHVRVVDSSHWWIGSDASFDRFPVAIWFAGEKDPESMKTRVQAILGGAAVQGDAFGSVAVDPGSQTCVAVLPRYLLRQMPRLLKKLP